MHIPTGIHKLGTLLLPQSSALLYPTHSLSVLQAPLPQPATSKPSAIARYTLVLRAVPADLHSHSHPTPSTYCMHAQPSHDCWRNSAEDRMGKTDWSLTGGTTSTIHAVDSARTAYDAAPAENSKLIVLVSDGVTEDWCNLPLTTACAASYLTLLVGSGKSRLVNWLSCR